MATTSLEENFLATEQSNAFFYNICAEHIPDIEERLTTAGILTSGKHIEDFMQTNQMAGTRESVFDVFLRSTDCLAEAGKVFYEDGCVEEIRLRFLKAVSSFEIILGSAILTNAGRRRNKSISACSIPPLDLSRVEYDEIAQVVKEYHSRGMGTGFFLDNVEHPAEMVKYLNQVAIKEVQNGVIERSVGNMGVLSIDHPKVLEFIRVKTDHPEIKEWKFNLSVNITDLFMNALNKGQPFQLKDGSYVDPQLFMQQIAQNAHATGDPGIVFMDRINSANRVPQIGPYRTVVPCGEVSLFEGEVCQFAYLNLMSFLIFNEIDDEPAIDKEALRYAVHTAIILLDNAVEFNIKNVPNQQSADIISNLRRIGIGICGFSEVLQAFGEAYESEQGRRIAANLMGFINFESKYASIELAKQRGPFPFFKHIETNKDFFLGPFKNHPTEFVSTEDWEDLERSFAQYGIRNLSTTILPPTGRSSLIAGVTPSIEPPFRLVANKWFKKCLERLCKRYHYKNDLQSIYEHVKASGSVRETSLPDNIKNVFKAALEISAENHIAMTAAFQKHIDEGISKTVNLPFESSVDDVAKIYCMAYEYDLKGITVYRDGCKSFQPKALNVNIKNPHTIVDPIYGPVMISQRIGGLLESPLLKRLKGIHQNGSNYLVDPRQTTSRYEHSVGAMILTKKLGGSEEMQVAALLHDVSHTAFSHVVDIVFGDKNQNYHDRMRGKFLESELAQEMLTKFSITNEELCCEGIPLVKGKGLNVDRLDYCIRDLWKVNRIYHPQYSSILNDLIINENREIECKNIDTARLMFKKFIEANQEVYFQPKAEAAALVLACILRRMLSQGEIFESDLFLTDECLIQKINDSAFKEVFESINPKIEFEVLKSEGYLPVLRKLRYIDPVIYGLKGTLTDHCIESKRMLEEYLNTPTAVHYQIPLLEKFCSFGFI